MRRKKTQKKWWLLLLLSLLIGLGGYYYFQNQGELKPIISSDVLPALGDAKDIKEAAQAVADANYFTLQIGSVAEFETGESTGSINIVNPSSNIYPIAVDITLDDTKELIYTSGGINPNQEILGGKLLKQLAKGEYLATAKVSIYDPDTKERQGVTEAQVTIIVRN